MVRHETKSWNLWSILMDELFRRFTLDHYKTENA
jgi:hypothetical protein